jgi:hypothetical protein
MLDSFGTVAKAVPAACDNCHEPGTGQQYVPFWQEKIKGLHQQVSHRVDVFEQRAGLETDEQLAKESQRRVKNARSILESVASDGSWGVHNFKYTEAMLLRANEMITGTKPGVAREN